ncbi:hypothetical protein CC1G_13572 [Coprinopsis cinerea okayama7|uniref:Uncharacterized protein n=1 Tax=Coprinopsis cinerea (strain Okayama-7 / 130 / ATCC MYA-4618 / FGSC 9003) TaxID=240176 RepID=D6RJN3_COPC7|nr:hypothetical protein CC1G_13572 [Coprinopsis cinerea okayama7\|eukprot:XP_002912044.1 hypothetical protein CC1G_13572 [Coprinopsis cinerea okayama7\
MDSQSVVDGIAKWTPEWKRDRKGRVHKRDHMWDQDLWDALRFWDIPRDWNEADEFAKEVVWISKQKGKKRANVFPFELEILPTE